jgi:hypothetical protein
MKNGTMEIQSGNPFAHEERSHRTAMRLLIWGRISQTARDIIIAKNTPLRWEMTTRSVKEEDVLADFDFDPPVYTTVHGEELALEEEKLCPPPEGWRLVRCQRPVFPRNAEIAKSLNISERQLRGILERAYDKIEGHELFRLVMGDYDA